MEMKVFGLVFKAVFSILAMIIGCSIIVWVIYNEFIHRLPEYQRPPLAGPLGIAPAMIGVGVYWVKQVTWQLRGK
jgi:hypothetical protein